MASKENVLVFLKRHAGEILSVGEIATTLGYDVPITETYLQQLAAEGEVRRTAAAILALKEFLKRRTQKEITKALKRSMLLDSERFLSIWFISLS